MGPGSEARITSVAEGRLLVVIMAHFGKHQYWDERYTKDTEPFEWYQNYQGFREHIHEYLRPAFKILNVGCGNSLVSEDMHRDGFTDITNIDISSTVIEQMIDRTNTLPGLSWQVMDCRNMEFDDETFDAVLDKGCLDTLLAGETSQDNVSDFLEGVARIIKTGGTYMCISVGIPEQRLTILQNQDLSWDVTVLPLTKPVISEDVEKYEPVDTPLSAHYLYICKSGGNDDEG